MQQGSPFVEIRKFFEKNPFSSLEETQFIFYQLNWVHVNPIEGDRIG